MNNSAESYTTILNAMLSPGMLGNSPARKWLEEMLKNEAQVATQVITEYLATNQLILKLETPGKQVVRHRLHHLSNLFLVGAAGVAIYANAVRAAHLDETENHSRLVLQEVTKNTPHDTGSISAIKSSINNQSQEKYVRLLLSIAVFIVSAQAVNNNLVNNDTEKEAHQENLNTFKKFCKRFETDFARQISLQSSATSRAP